MSTHTNQDNPGLPAPPFAFGLSALGLSILLEFIWPLRFLAPPGFTSLQSWLGLVVMVAAWSFALSGDREFRRNGTNVDPAEPAVKLITSGPYRYTRNPMYLGMTIVLVGISLIFSLEWGLILAPVLLIAFDRLVVVREEAYMTAKFGQPYRDFLKRTRRWL